MNQQYSIPPVKEMTMLERARSISALVRAEARASEKLGTMTPAVVKAMKEAGLFWMLLEKRVGGFQASMADCMEAWEEIAAADASAGWSLMANSTGTAVPYAFCDQEAVDVIYGGPVLPVMAGMLGPGGTAVEEAGGLSGSGQYRFGSGSLHADWIGSGLFVKEGDGIRKLADGSPAVRVSWCPAKAVDFDDEWDVMGLRGTGSVDYQLRDIVIPAGFHHERSTTKSERSWRLYDIGIPGLACAGHTGVILGLMKRALEEITRIAFGKKRPAYSVVLGEQQVFRHDFAYHEAAYHAARDFTLRLYAETQDYLEGGGELTPAMRARFRQNCIYVHKVGAEVVRFCHTMGGSGSIRNDSDLARCMRDMYVATQHIFVDTISMQDVAVPILEDWRAHAAQAES